MGIGLKFGRCSSALIRRQRQRLPGSLLTLRTGTVWRIRWHSGTVHVTRARLLTTIVHFCWLTPSSKGSRLVESGRRWSKPS